MDVLGEGAMGMPLRMEKGTKEGPAQEDLAGYWPCTGPWTLAGVESHGSEQKEGCRALGT